MQKDAYNSISNIEICFLRFNKNTHFSAYYPLETLTWIMDLLVMRKGGRKQQNYNGKLYHEVTKERSNMK